MADLMTSILPNRYLALVAVLGIGAGIDTPGAAQAAAQKVNLNVAVKPAALPWTAAPRLLAMLSAVRNGEIVAQQEVVIESGAANTGVQVVPGVYDVRLEGEGLVTEIKHGFRVLEEPNTNSSYLIRPGKGVHIIEWAAGGLSREEVAVRLSALEVGLAKLQQPGATLVSPADKVYGAVPCCNVTAIDRTTGRVTARDVATKRSFQFQATGTVVAALTIGQKTWANFNTNTVSIDGAAPCCEIIAPVRP